WQLVAAVEDQRFRRVEVDLAAAEQRDPPGLCDERRPFRDGIDVDGLRLFALEAEQHRTVAAMSLDGEAQAAEELDLHPGGLREVPIFTEPLGEPLGRAHRSDG